MSVQVLSEFASVMRRLHLSWPDIEAALSEFGRFCRPPAPLTLQTHGAAMTIAASTGYHIYDSLLIAAALQVGCTIFLSEDMQHGRVIEGRLTIVNPFG